MDRELPTPIPVETVRNVLGVVAGHMGNGELDKVMQALPKNMQSLFPAMASAV